MATVVIGEDTADLAAVLSRILTRAGFAVRVAPDGPATLAAVQAAPPDLLVLDVIMPRLNGLDVCRAVRADPATAGVGVLIVSACPFPQDVAAGFEAGADDYMAKPFDNADLIRRAHAIVAARAQPPAADTTREPEPDATA